MIYGQESYQSLINEIKNDRLTMARNDVSIDSCRNYLLKKFELAVYPKWIGTKWDFNGYSNSPGPDKLIACGYFVSTPLKHMGFNWNRYDLAKMYSRDIVSKTCSNVVEYQQIDSVLYHINQAPPNLYIVGLDNHVGFLLKRNSKIYFVHSNYINLKGPDKENPTESIALNSSRIFVLGTFLNDENIEKWLKGSAFTF